MKVKKAKADDKSGTNSQTSDSEDSLAKEKQQLKNQISELQSLISKIEGNLNITRFGDINKTAENLVSFTANPRLGRNVPNVDALYRKEIFRYIGFNCAKITKTEYVFNYKPYDKIGRNETYSIQIFNKGGKGSLGKWVMPLGIHPKHILHDTPIKNLSMIVPLLKNWILYIDCYTQRKLQFYEVKESISDLSNCTIEANPGFTWITLRLFGLHNKVKESYFDLTVYLTYRRHETRPCNINAEWSLKKCSEKQENELNAYTKCFKNVSISEGFRLLTETPHPIFSWSTEQHEDNPLELNDTSDSDEESFIEMIKQNREKSVKKRRKRRKSKGKKKAEKSQQKFSLDEENVNLSSEARSSPEKMRKTLKLPLQLQQNNSESENIINELTKKPGKSKIENSTIVEVHEIPEATAKKKLKLDKKKSADKIDGKLISAKKQGKLVGILSTKKEAGMKINRAVTSTPLRTKIANKVKFVPMSDVELSPIVSAVDENN